MRCSSLFSCSACTLQGLEKRQRTQQMLSVYEASSTLDCATAISQQACNRATGACPFETVLTALGGADCILEPTHQSVRMSLA